MRIAKRIDDTAMLGFVFWQNWINIGVFHAYAALAVMGCSINIDCFD